MQSETEISTLLTNNNNNNTNAQPPLWTKTLTKEQIAYLEAIHRKTHRSELGKHTLIIDLEETVKDMLRPDNITVQGNVYSRHENISLKLTQIKALTRFNQLLENKDIEDIRDFSDSLKLIFCTHNQTWLEKLAVEFLNTSNLLYRSITLKVDDSKVAYLKAGNITKHQVTSSINGYDYPHNTTLNLTKPIVSIESQEDYEFCDNRIERKNKEMKINALAAEASVILPQQTLPILMTATDIEKIDLKFDTQKYSGSKSNFVTECFSQCAAITINEQKFLFSSIDFIKSDQKLLELCRTVFEAFVDEKNQPLQDMKKTLREEYFLLYQTDYENAVAAFVKQQSSHTTKWQQHNLNKFKPVLVSILKNDAFIDITQMNQFVTSYDIKLDGNVLTIEETARFFQTNSENSCYLSLNSPLLSFKLTHTFKSGWFKTHHSISPLSLVMHESLDNILNVRNPDAQPKSLEEILPNMTALLPQVSKAQSSYSSICCAFRCCLPKYQRTEESDSDDEIEIENISLPPSPKTMKREENEKQQHLEVDAVTSSVTSLKTTI